MASLGEWIASRDYKNLGLLACLLVTLWCMLGLVFWGKLNIALTIRQQNYFEVGFRWNGDFEKHRAELESNIVGGLTTQPHSTGYADIPLGCVFSELDDRFLALDDNGIVKCTEEHWSVPPWVRE